jgi:hypothetical protein
MMRLWMLYMMVSSYLIYWGKYHTRVWVRLCCNHLMILHQLVKNPSLTLLRKTKRCVQKGLVYPTFDHTTMNGIFMNSRGLGYLAKHSCIANIMRDHILDR